SNVGNIGQGAVAIGRHDTWIQGLRQPAGWLRGCNRCRTMRSSVACMLVLAACVEHEPAPDMEAEQLACQALGPHCDGDTAVRCKVDHPDPIEQVLGIGTRTYEVR